MRLPSTLCVLPILAAAACGGTTADDLCAQSGATGAALRLELDDGEVVHELYLDASVDQSDGQQVYTFGRGLGRVVTEGSEIVAFTLPLRSGAVIHGSGAQVVASGGLGLIDAEVETDGGRGRLVACLPAR